jgi:hypothetical protein
MPEERRTTARRGGWSLSESGEGGEADLVVGEPLVGEVILEDSSGGVGGVESSEVDCGVDEGRRECCCCW